MRRPLQFMTIEAILAQMGNPPHVTLGDIAAFYKISVQQLIRWSTSAFTPDDRRGAARCSCTFVQRETFGYTGFDVSAPRTDQGLSPELLHCTQGIAGHRRQRLLAQVAVCETAGQAPTLGLWYAEAELGADTCVSSLAPLTLDWAPGARIPLVLAVRHIWREEMRTGLETIHDDAMDPTKYVVGYLHSILLALPRGLMHTVAKLAQGRKLLDVFNRQHSMYWTAEPKGDKGKLEPPTFHGPVAKALIRWYDS
jgi:hypothetical protein